MFSSLSFLFFRKYSTITALEQRQKYNEDFCAEYDEYRALHDRIGAITEMFVQLGSKINTLSPGTQEYKVLSALEGYSSCSVSCKSPQQIRSYGTLTPFLIFAFSAYGGTNTTEVSQVQKSKTYCHFFCLNTSIQWCARTTKTNSGFKSVI